MCRVFSGGSVLSCTVCRAQITCRLTMDAGSETGKSGVLVWINLCATMRCGCVQLAVILSKRGR